MQRTIRQNLTLSLDELSAGSRLEVLPRSTEEAEAVLTSHVLGCRHCLAVALYRTETLAETGCREYKALLSRAKAGVELHSGGHVSAIVAEEYCLAHLCTFDRQRVDDHVAVCDRCEETIHKAYSFVSTIKAALNLVTPAATRAAAGSIH